MKRDMDLIRQILGYVADQETWGLLEYPTLPPQSAGTITYHVILCEEAGYLHLTKDSRGRERIERLTWAGHEFLALD